MDIRPFESRDLSEVIRLLERALPAEAISLETFVRQVLLDPNFLPAGAPVARAGDTVAGFGLAIARQVPLENAPPDSDRGYITLLGVAPECRKQGLGSALLERCEVFLREQGRRQALISPYSPGYFAPGVDVHAYSKGLRYLGTRGYGEVYRPLSMETSLWRLEAPEWVRDAEGRLREEGLEFSAWRPDLTLPLLRFAAEEFKGDWVRFVREAAHRILEGDPPERLIAAYEADTTRIVGFCHFERERFGPIGTAPSQRGRGIGQVLMFKTLEAQRRLGHRVSWFLWSDDSTARRLYDSAGFREVRRFAVLKKEL